MTVVEPDELLTAILVPQRGDARRGVAIDEVARRHGDFALAGAIAVIDLDDDDRVARAAIAMFGMGSTPLRAPTAEQTLRAYTRAQVDLAAVAQLAVRDTDPPDDVHATGAYRTRACAHLVARVLDRAFEEATSAAR
jgi:carbon-monoxide dehydrogenase medium subunit